MAAIYLKHPVHGTKVATLDMEAVFDEMHGWARFDPAAECGTVEDANALAPRRGRPRRTETQED